MGLASHEQIYTNIPRHFWFDAILMCVTSPGLTWRLSREDERLAEGPHRLLDNKAKEQARDDVVWVVLIVADARAADEARGKKCQKNQRQNRN